MTEYRFDDTVTAIVSAYKAERFIRGCLEDLTAQTLFQAGKLEIIVINSGSPENEDAIVGEYVARYPAAIHHVRTEERETIYRAWNRGVHLAHGRYLTNANVDDRHRRDALEIMAAHLDRHPEVALAYADCDVTTVENGTFGATSPNARFSWPDFDARHLFQICYIGPQPMWRRSLHDHHGMFDPSYRSAGDYEFWLRLAASGERFLHIPETLGLYLQSPGGVEHANQRLSWEESNRARTIHWPASWGARPKPAGNYLFPLPSPSLSGSAPLVSVIIPTRNRPEFLARAIRSVLEQTYGHIEIIVINDGGVDVQELIDHLNPHGSIRYFNLPTGVERSAARNLGLRAAQGTHVAYLDDDDRYLPRHIETLVTRALESGCRVVYSDAFRVQLDISTGLPDETRRDIPYSLDFDPVRIYIENYIPILCLMHERSCLDEAGTFDERLSRLEDWDLWIRLSQVARFHHVPQATCEFTWHSGGSSQTLDNAPLFLSAYKTICGKHGAVTQRNASIRLWQQGNIFNKTCHTFEYLKRLLSPLLHNHHASQAPYIPPETINALRDRGVETSRVESAICLITSLSGCPAIDSERWLGRALAFDDENHPARMQLVTLLMNQQRYHEATTQLERLHFYNPVDVATIGALADLYTLSAREPKRALDILAKGLWLFPGQEALKNRLEKIQGR